MLALVPVADLRAALDYDPDTGALRWKLRADRDARWNARFAGKAAGRLVKGYLTLRWNGQQLSGHRVAWAMHYGAWPAEFLDHVNGDKQDNRIANLREATVSQNGFNRPAASHNKSGFKGVSYGRRERKWRATIRSNKQQHHLGWFATPEAAHAAYAAAARGLHGAFARVN